MAPKKAKIFLSVKAPGSTPFILNSFRGVERLSDLFEYTLLMTAKSKEVSFDTMIGKDATVSIEAGTTTRTFNGIIGHFEQVDTPFKPLDMWTTYRATLYPKLWLLTFSGQCRIFQNKSAIEIIKKVLEESKVPFTNQVRKSGTKARDYCVQYNETNFNFICRLMEEEGIFYFFQQDKTGHKLILADSLSSHPACPNAPTAGFHDSAAVDQFMMKVSSCFISQRIVTGSDTLKSYNYLTPHTALKANATGDRRAGGGNLTSYHEIYGKQSLGDELVKVRLQAEEFPQKRVEGVSTVPFFIAGYKFKLEKHPRKDANIQYTLYEVIHEAQRGSDDPEEPLYKNTYTAFPATIQFRPPQITPKPRIYSTQTARVTGKKNEEIYTEEYGRIKVKFHWDPSTKNDETTSCWIRVATLWAGKKWGSVFTPRIGHEVVVSFIDGDPDKPLVVGSVYNGDNKPPYLPSNPTKSTIRSLSTKKGEGFNEFRFEDKKYSEEIYIHAQKDFKMDIQNNHDITIVGGNRNILLKAASEKHERRTGTRSHDILKLNDGNKKLQIMKGNYLITLWDGNIKVKCLSGDVDFDVIGDISFKCTGKFSVDALQAISMKTLTSFTAEALLDSTVKAGGSATIEALLNTTVKAGVSATMEAVASATVEAGASLTLQAGANATMRAGMNATVMAGVSATLQAAANASVKGGGMVDITGGGMVNVKGGMVSVMGGLIKFN